MCGARSAGTRTAAGCRAASPWPRAADAILRLAQMDKIAAAVLTVDGGVVATPPRQGQPPLVDLGKFGT